ncbi:MAG: aminotransferase class IV, partial [Ignavibacteriae bacterium]|nr:aminotransferase class IV [Ignavibacteriota bacterium]
KEYFELLETLLWENGNYFLLDYHLKRLRKSADYFLFNFDQEKIATELKNISSNLNENVKYKVRLLLNKWGSTKIEYSEIAENHAEANVALSRKIRCENEKFLYHKTTYRPWDEELRIAKQKGFDEVLFVNEKDELLEGAISNIVIEKNGKLFTPPLSLGILNGCYRQYLIDQNLCNERLLTLEDLRNADKIFICNSVREMIEISKFFNDL